MEIRERLARVKCFVLDMDGTFNLSDTLIEGSLDFLAKAEQTGRRVMFLTNNSGRSTQACVDKLVRLGAKNPVVLTAGRAAGDYVLEHFPRQKACVLGNELLRGELRDMGVTIDDEHPDYVLIGCDTSLTYETVTRAANHIKRGLPYIATHHDRICPVDGGFIPDCGAIMAMIEACTDRKPDVIVGKPYKPVADELLRMTGLRADELAMVGDRLYTDIATGLAFGMTSILVLTGEATREDVEQSPYKPDLIFERLSDMNKYL